IVGIKPLGYQQMSGYLQMVDSSALSPLEKGWHNRLRWLVDDSLALQNPRPGIFKTFYRNRRDLLTVDKPGFRLFVNPVLYTVGGIDRNNFPDAASINLPIYLNTRGAVLRGSIGNKLGFYTELSDNIQRAQQFLYQEYSERERLPGEGFVKQFGDANGLDYFHTRGYITYQPWSFMRLKFGQDRAFWGQGYQSLQLSDHAANYLLFNISTRIWKLEYVNHFTQFIDFIQNKNDTEGTFPRKYGAYHLLNYHINPRLSIGLFESVIYAAQMPNGTRGLELQYLNPIIFYRSVEQYIGSPDNAFLGFTWRANFFKRLQFYGQFMLDDYNYSRRNDGTGFWGNKFGWQGGLKYIDAFNISTLDLQIESNRIRPYTYQHFNVASNFTQFGQSLGHGAGGNLQDLHLIARYRPWPAWEFMGHYMWLQQGREIEGDPLNYGTDLDLSTLAPRPGDFGNTIGQGALMTINQLYGRISWQFWGADAYIDLEGRVRQENNLRSTSVLFGLRANIGPRMLRF
ncbi:MAG: hypothetical protein AAFV07_17975, partial [Bacteroidota bacterium]